MCSGFQGRRRKQVGLLANFFFGKEQKKIKEGTGTPCAVGNLSEGPFWQSNWKALNLESAVEEVLSSQLGSGSGKNRLQLDSFSPYKRNCGAVT